MTNTAPLISVIVPAYNAEKYLADALKSIIAQNYEPMEIIVVDDGSTDGTAEAATGFLPAIRYIYQENAGPAAARNRGLQAAQGEIFAFLDADDWWSSDKLRLQLPYLGGDSEFAIVIGSLQYVKLSETDAGGREYEPHLAPWLGSSFGAALIKRWVFDRVGLIDPEMEQAEDIDWFLRAEEQGVPRKVLQDVVLFYRLHDNNVTHDRAKAKLYYLKALKRSMTRRREHSDER